MSEKQKIIQQAVDELVSRELPEGGFRYSGSGAFSPEASAWAALALESYGAGPESVIRACRKLAAIQLPDGSVPAVAGYSKAVWCTPLSLLAWKLVPGHMREIKAGLNFLLTSKGKHYVKPTNSPAGHDTSLVGWAWVKDTHSWIEPTSLSLLTLKAFGYQQHSRVWQAVMMLMNRQLPSGGWNYGNTTVFGQELRPIPENTGQALCALGGMVEKDKVENSLRFLEASLAEVRTPMALAWTLLGLGVWSSLSGDWKKRVYESLELQHRYGPYDTVLLSQLVLAHSAEGDWHAIFA